MYHECPCGCKRGKRCCLHPSAKTYTLVSLDKALHKHSLNLHGAGRVTPSCKFRDILGKKKAPDFSGDFSRIPTDLVVLWDIPYPDPLSGYRSGLVVISTRYVVDVTIATVTRWTGYPDPHYWMIFKVYYLYMTWATFHSYPFSFLFCVHFIFPFLLVCCVKSMCEKFGKGRATPCRDPLGVVAHPLSGLLGNSVAEHLIGVGVGWVGIGYRFI